MPVEPDATVSETLLALVHREDAPDALDIWRALDTASREAGLAAMFAEPGEAHRRETLVQRSSRKLHFRPQTLRGYSHARLAGKIAQLEIVSDDDAAALLRILHTRYRRPLLKQFLDAVGIPHQDGITDDDLPDATVEEATLEHAGEELLKAFEADQVVTYFLTMWSFGVGFAPLLMNWLRDRFPPARVPLVKPTPPLEADGPAAEEVPDEFTRLDILLIRVMVDCAQGIEGALTADELEDVLDEVVSLNSTRHRSYFHAGFRDGILGYAASEDLPAANRPRREWYWAGYVQGLTRLEKWDAIVACFDQQSIVRELGRTGEGASDLAARCVFKALCQTNRAPEAAGFLTPECIANCDGLLRDIHEAADPILRDDRAADARGLFDALGSAIELLESRGVDTWTRDFLEYRRRRAHCYRQLGEAKFATRLLEDLLREEFDPLIRATVLTDLGLIDAGFRRLSDLRLPPSRDSLAVFRDSLELGAPRFEAAMAEAPETAVHARYCMGVVALVRGDFPAAVDHFDVALSGFEAAPHRYSTGGLINTARMYLGLSLALDVQAHRAARARDLLIQGLGEGYQVPSYLLTGVVDGLALADVEHASQFGEASLKVVGPEQLDALISSELLTGSRLITDALLLRAKRADRLEQHRVEDWYAALQGLLRQERVDEAAEVLDNLEAAAMRGLQTDRFLELLQGERGYAPAWSHEDARSATLHCLEATGRYEDAFAELATEFHQVLARLGSEGVPYAEGLLEQIASYGLPPEAYGHLSARLEASRPRPSLQASARPEVGSFRPRIMFVGGNEIQAKRDEHVLAELRTRAPHVSVTFRHTGWTSNWSAMLEEILRELPQHDGVVLSRFMRTTFGRNLRDKLEVPWRSCGGAGIRAIVASVLEVEEAVRQAAARRVHGDAP